MINRGRLESLIVHFVLYLAIAFARLAQVDDFAGHVFARLAPLQVLGAFAVEGANGDAGSN